MTAQSGSESKLNTISDGVKVMQTIFSLYKNYKPLSFFSIIAGVMAVLGLLFFVPAVMALFQTGEIKVPSIIVSMLLFVCTLQSLFSGLILDNIIKTSKQTFEMRLIDCEHRLNVERDQ